MSDHLKKRDSFPKKEIKQQLDDLLKSGQSLQYEKDIPLTPQDIALFKTLFFKVTLLFIIISFPFVLAIYFFRQEEIVLLISGGVLLFLIIAIARATYQLSSSLRTGKKTLVRGIITDRFTKKNYGEVDEDGKRAEKILNYLQIGTREFQVNKQIYKIYKTGEAVELHFIMSAWNKPYFLHHSKLKDAGLRITTN